MNIAVFIVVLLYEIAIFLFLAGVFLDIIGLDIVGLLNPRIEEKKLWWLMYTFSMVRLIGVSVASYTTMVISFFKLLEGAGSAIKGDMKNGLFVALASVLWLFIATGISAMTTTSIKDYNEERKKWK
jgi:hypothetical protein